MFKLKKNVADFVVVDGPSAGKRYRAGEVYAEVPPEYKNKFEPARPVLEAAASNGARGAAPNPAAPGKRDGAPAEEAADTKLWLGGKDKKGGKK